MEGPLGVGAELIFAKKMVRENLAKSGGFVRPF